MSNELSGPNREMSTTLVLAQQDGFLMYSSYVCEQRAETQLVRHSTSLRLDLHNAFRYLLEGVAILHGYFHSYFGRFLNFSAHQEFIQDEISLLKVENDVQLTHLKQTHKTTFVLLQKFLSNQSLIYIIFMRMPVVMLLKIILKKKKKKNKNQ